MSDSELIGLNENLLCKTTGWHFNCGLNCLTHFLYSKLEKNELQKLFEKNVEYKDLLITFQEYYELPDPPTWDEVKALLTNLAAPTDREAVFSPILRKHLGKIMTRQAADLWESEGAAALSEFIATGKAKDIAEPIVKSNQAFFDEIKKEYDSHFQKMIKDKITPAEREEALAKINTKTELNEQNILDMVIFLRKNKIEDSLQAKARNYWVHQHGCENYANFLGDLNHSVMISADQLELLCHKLKIGAEIYTPDSISAAKKDLNLALLSRGAQNMPESELTWTMKVYNHGSHWEYEEPDGKLKQKDKHNYFYPDSFYENDSKLGKFKTHGNDNQSQIKQILEHVKNWWDTKLKSEPNKPVPVLEKKSPPITIAQTTKSNANKSVKLKGNFEKLHRESEKVINGLLNKLEPALNNNKIDSLEKQMIFEFYFNALEAEFKKTSTDSVELDEKKIKAIIKEIQNGDISIYRLNAIQDGLTNFDRKFQDAPSQSIKSKYK